jgi:patatin-like phospholipase/acyl hydrolase
MLQLYFKEGQKIFNRSGWYAIRSGWSIFDAKFQAEGIEEVLQTYFGEARLKEVLTEVLITSYETQDIVKPWFFKSARAKKDASYDFPLKLVGRATSAAPTYFEPAYAEKNGFSEGLNFIDGGVFANNPSMCAYVEAKNLFPNEEVMLVSLGTGALTRKISYEESKDWGVAEWARPILNVVFDGVADTIHYQLSQLLGKEQYMQFEVSLKDGGSDDMDDASLTNMRVLKNLAEELIRKRQDDLDKLCETLIK